MSLHIIQFNQGDELFTNRGSPAEKIENSYPYKSYVRISDKYLWQSLSLLFFTGSIMFTWSGVATPVRFPNLPFSKVSEKTKAVLGNA